MAAEELNVEDGRPRPSQQGATEHWALSDEPKARRQGRAASIANCEFLHAGRSTPEFSRSG